MTSSKLKSNSKSDSKSWEKKNRSGYDRANFFTKYFCLFVTPFLYRHYSDENFDLDAIDHCSKDDKCERLGNNLQKHWTVELEKHRSGKCASLLRAIFKAFGLQFFGTNLKNFFVYGVFRMGMPMILGRIIYYSNEYFDDKIWFQDNENKTVNASLFDTYNLVPQNVADPDILNQYLHFNNRQNVILYSGFLAVVIFINVCVSHPNFFAKYRYGMNVRVAVTRLVYEKALQISQQTVQRITAGKIVNLISNDANRFDNAYVYVEFLYTAVLETSIGMYFMYQYIGRSCFGIVGILVFYIPFQIISAKVLNKFRIQSIVLTDNRLRLMTEILSAMRVIKMYVWERPFAALVSKARKQEIGKIRNSMNMRALNLALDFVAPKIMSFTCLILFILDNGKLTAENVFVTMALIAQIRDIITYMFPMGITFGVEAYVSVKRIEKFLLEDEIEHSISRRKSLGLLNPKKVFNPKISLKRVTCQIKNTRILKDISFDVTPGNVTCLIGPVGSGKSTVLQCILRELPVSGQVDVDGKLIYVPQEAWIFNGTVRENILFGAEFDPVRYRKVVRASALSEDFKQFSESDQTVVDDRGTSLSGGQRARISLARALYADADCYLLDDPLSAVDASVAKHIFEECIKDYLKDKCVVLVTHQVQFAKSVDQVVVLKDGACLAKGTYMDIVNQGIDIFKYAATEAEKPQPHQPNSVDSPLSSPLISRHAFAFRTESINSIENLPTGNVSEIDCGASSVGDYIDFDTNNNPVSTQKRLSVHNVEMNNSNDKSKFKIYWIYIQAGAGILLFSTFVISNFVSQILFTGSDFWLSAWTDFLGKSAKHDLNHNFTYEVSPIISRDKNTNVYIYSGLIAILFIFSFIRTFTFFTICMRASVNFHNRIFASLIQAPILFFDKTPLGIILNRVSRDLGIIDDILPPAAFDALAILFNSFGVFILCTVLNYWIIIPFVALMVMIYFANRFYVNTARQVKRLEGVARSPLLNQMSTTLAGLATIRSYGKEDMFLERFSETQDLHSAIYFTFIAASRFYGIFLEFVCVAYIYCFILMMNFNLDNYTASLIGLTISQTLQLTNTFNWGIRQYAEVETFMTSVERINEFGQLNTEELDKGQREPAENWPTRGDVLYRNVGLIYKNPADSEEPAKTVLHDLTFSIQSGEKIGIVGRTGAGKSSLITTLFRLTQPIGSIWIDGVSTGEISLSRLRKALSIIPQEPILFSGDIRHNLDPFNEKSDEELWDAITKVQLKSKIKSLPGMLSAPVSECGADFSVGQKQLICMARAILRKNRILILDEATANVDPGTDSLIQQTIRNEFGHCTVMTIAHRLNTIIDYDRVMVLDAGSLAQFDSPYALIKQQSGIFYEYLYSNLNKESRDELYKAAKKAYTVKQFQSQL